MYFVLIYVFVNVMSHSIEEEDVNNWKWCSGNVNIAILTRTSTSSELPETPEATLINYIFIYEINKLSKLWIYIFLLIKKFKFFDLIINQNYTFNNWDWINFISKSSYKYNY